MINISDRRNLLIKVYVIGYPNRGESICILFLDAGYDNKVLYSIVIDSFKYKGLNETLEILKQWGIDKEKLNMLVWSHPDYDHTYGINEIINKFCNENTMVILPYDLNGELWNKVKYNREDKNIDQNILKLTRRKYKSHETACVPEKMFVPFKNLVFNDLIGDLSTTIQAVSPHGSRINYLLESHSEIHKNDLSLCLQIDIGNDYKYAVEQIMLMLFPGESPVYPASPSGALRAELRLSDGERFSTATCTITTAEGTSHFGKAAVDKKDFTDPIVEQRLRQRIVKLSFYRAGLKVLG